MAPVEDTTGHWDQYNLPSLDDLHSTSPHFLVPNQANLLNPSSRDLPEFHCGISSMKSSEYPPSNRGMARHNHDKHATTSDHASTSSTPGSTRRRPGQRNALSSWSKATNALSARSQSSSNFGASLHSPELLSHVGIKATLSSRDLPPAQNDGGFMDDERALFHPSSSLSTEGPLSPLSFYHMWKGDEIPLGCLSDDLYDPAMYSENLGHIHDLGNISSAAVDHDNSYQATNPLFGIFPWTSPGSTDTDLDDESSMSSSISSLSPEYSDAELRHSSTESEEDDDDDVYSPPCSSPPMYRHANDNLYHIEQYPSPFDLYKPVLQSPHDDSDNSLSPPSPPSPLQGRPRETNIEPTTPAEQTHPFGLGLSPFPNSDQFYTTFYRHFDDDSITIPCSPSRRRSMDLPSFDDDSCPPHSLAPYKSPSRSTWLSLPGAETDDDLISADLASKSYVPDPTITVPTTPPSASSGGLLIWDPDGHDTFLRPPRSPSPEDFQIDPSVVVELAGAEGEKVYQLRQRTARKEIWERERYGELSALLRLKLGLDKSCAAGGANGDDDDCCRQSKAIDTARRSASDPTPISTEGARSAASSSSQSSSTLSSTTPVATLLPPTTAATALPRSSSTPQPYAHPHKPKITSMAQLVANMVFHRQQQDMGRKKPIRRMSSWEPATSTSGGSITNTKGHPTPTSPLRQVLIPEEAGNDDGEGSGSITGIECESPLPLSPLCLTMSPLPLFSQLN